MIARRDAPGHAARFNVPHGVVLWEEGAPADDAAPGQLLALVCDTGDQLAMGVFLRSFLCAPRVTSYFVFTILQNKQDGMKIGLHRPSWL